MVPTHAVGVMVDDTEVLALANSLNDANAQLALAVELGQISVWRHDLRSNRLYYNRRGFEVLAIPYRAEGLSLDEVRTYIHPDDLASVVAAGQQALKSDTPTDMEARYRRSDGSWRHVLTRRVVQRDVQGQPLAFIGVALDITDRRLAEDARREALAAQRQSEAKSQFLARMSHELRTPLNAILGFTQLLESDAKAPAASKASAADAGAAEQRQFKLHHIRQAAEHLLSLVNEVLDLSSIDAGRLQLRPESVALDALLQEVLPQVEPAARARSVKLHAERAGCNVLADRERLRQVLVKLLGHRIGLIAAGSTVRVTAAGEGDDTVISIDDDGQGLSEAQQLNLFEPFSRVGSNSGEEPDAGVDLALVKSLMAFMGGRIELECAPAGTRFVLRLPRADTAPLPGLAPVRAAEVPAQPMPPLSQDTSVEQAAVHPRPTAASSDGKVLYIEDNLVNVVLVQELIAQRGGLELVCETTGERGVARAREWQPDLVLIDMHLPDFDGFEVLRRLRAQPAISASRCVALSANAMPEDVSRALAAGFDDYWTKPIRFSSFLAGLDELFPNRSTA